MNYQLIILVFLLVFTIGCALRAALSTVSKNICRFISIPIAFLICYALQSGGLFSAIGLFTEEMLAKDPSFGAMLEASPYLRGLSEGTVTAISSAILFPIVFVVLYFVIRLILSLTVGKLLAKALERENEAKGIVIARTAGSSVVGAVGGVFLSAVLLMPIFYIFSFASAVAGCARIPCEEEIALHEELEIIDETFIVPYEQAPAVHFYEAVGLKGLMCHTAELGSRVEIDGHQLSACETIRNVLTHVPNIYVHMEAWSVSDAPMAEDFVALSDDPFVLGIIADILSHEAKAYANGEPGIFLHPEAEHETTSSYIVEIFAKTYGESTHLEIENDLHTILAAGGALAESNFFNDFTRSFETGTDGDEAMANVLLANLGYVGRVMDALYVSDPTHKFSDTIFDILLENDEVQKFVSKKTIDDLNNAVEAGETTYESFTLFLQGLMGIVTNQTTTTKSRSIV